MSRASPHGRQYIPHRQKEPWNRTLSKLSGEQHAALPKEHTALSPDPLRFPCSLQQTSEIISNYSSDTKAETLSKLQKES